MSLKSNSFFINKQYSAFQNVFIKYIATYIFVLK